MAAHLEGQTSSRDRVSLEDWTSTRRPYLDNLKVALITAIIVIHAVLGYSTLEAWTYTELREVTLAPVTEIVLLVLLSPFAFFLIALLFLVAGLLTAPSLERKGTARFVRDRLLRLGVPFGLYVLLVQPALAYALRHPLGSAPGSFWAEYLAAGRLDTGPLWFVGVLLIFSLGYAGWAGRRRGHGHGQGHRRITLRTLLLATGVVAPASFAIRLIYPYGSESGVTDLNFWEWPVCITAFAVGVAASGQGWLTAVPEQLAGRCRTLTLAGVVAMAALLATVSAGRPVDEVLGGWHWPAAVFAVVDAVLTVFGSVWLLSVAQHRLNRPYRWGQRLSRSAYGAFMLQTLFLLGLALALRPLDLPAEAKALIVALGAVTGSYLAAWFLISRAPGVAKVL
ncbi:MULTISPECIES: acyltransferase [unclassified Kribbella]|uniref:acyltransferase family protein n=1 Tax=unclassified Kribbella TaxID=2644121 RepID=UPI0033C19FF8